MRGTVEKEYTQNEISQMKERCAAYEYGRLDVGDIYDILIEGHSGWKRKTRKEVVEYYKIHNLNAWKKE